MSDHTPGPWVWTPDRETIHGYSHEGEAIVVVYELGTNENDASLIAAAPDLLKACRQALYALKGREHDQFLRDAIAKATGEQS